MRLSRAKTEVAARAAAKSTDTPRSELHALASHESAVVRRALAANVAAPASALERLARDADPQVRVAVASNLSTSANALRTLLTAPAGPGFAGLARRKALLAVADHPNTTPELLRRLAGDSDPLVARRAAARG
jgi:hypothetical protein